MALPEQIKNLRKEHGWSQVDLATRINADAGQISRYENGKTTPSVEAFIHLTEIFNVSTDYLLLDDVPHRPYRSPADPVLDHLTDLDSLQANTRIRAALHNAG